MNLGRKLLVVGSSVGLAAFSTSAVMASTPKTIYDFSAVDIDGNEVSLDKYRGKVCIIANVASK